MRRFKTVVLLVTLIPALASAHVTVRPRESKAGATERYTVRVPTEGTVATIRVELEIPEGVTVTDVSPAEGATYEARRLDGRIVAITWIKEIPPKAVAEFTFTATNSSTAQELVWKAHQHFGDGTFADWTGPPGKRPASVTKLSPQ